MNIIYDKEFGDITVHRSTLSRAIKFSVAPSGQVKVSVPKLTSLLSIKHLIASSRGDIRKLILQTERPVYDTDMRIGKSHHLHLKTGDSFVVHHLGLLIEITYPHDLFIQSQKVQSFIRSEVVKALRREAKHYLPKRLAYLAKQYNYTYSSTRFTHASSRWGSCSSNGTISLNIALMTLPFELIDYVLVHELCHTKEMNHSQNFWQHVASIYPDYKSRRKVLKKYSPIC